MARRQQQLVLIKDPNVRGVSDVDVQRIATAVWWQISRHVAVAWDRQSWSCIPSLYAIPGSYPIYLLPNPDIADALGYHDVDPSGMPYSRVFTELVLDNNGGVLKGDLSISSVVSHEAVEMFGDPAANVWTQSYNDGWDYAQELCDAVEAESYPISVYGTPVSVSNFLFPEWFDDQPQPGARFDQLNSLPEPFSMTSGGYTLRKQSDRVESVFAMDYPEWRKQTKLTRRSRTGLRLNRS